MLSARLPRSLAPNALSRAVESRRRRNQPLIDLTESNPTRVGLRYPPDLLAPLADASALEYDPQPLGLWPARAAAAAEFRRRGIPMSADRVALTASTSEAYALLFKLLCDAGEGVLVPRPSYPLFEHLTRFESVAAVPYDLERHGGWRIDLASIARAAHESVRAVLVVSPNNPTGSFLHRDDLREVAALCAERGWALVGDEVFADYALDAAPDAASVLAQSDVLTFGLGGMSKSCGLPQVKLGWIGLGGPQAEVDRALAGLELVADTYLSVATPVQVAAAALIEAGAEVRRQIQERIAGNLEALRRLAGSCPSVTVPPVEGGWSAVLQVPAIDTEERLALDLVDRGVLVHPGYFFDFPRESFVVVSLIVEPRAFAKGIAVVLEKVSVKSGDPT